MIKKNRVRINLLICAIILLGFVAVGAANYTSYSEVIRDDIANISKLTTTNIYAELRNELARPIVVSMTMANDSFLKAWILAESHGNWSEDHRQLLTRYLTGLKQEYGYNTAFVVSETTKRYYYHGGLNKIISREDAHDDWYYDFLEKDKPYDLDIDTDEVNRNQLTVFINCRITGENGKLMGVTGVGLELDRVQAMIKTFEDAFNLKAVLFNREGIVQVSTDTDEIYRVNVFDMPDLQANRQTVLSRRDLQSFVNTQGGGYIITQYIEDMDWHLLVVKDTSVLQRALNLQMANDFVIYVVVVIGVLWIVDNIIRRNDQRLVNMAKTDSLTGLVNRRGFNEALSKVLSRNKGKQLFLFLVDIDNFKQINDSHGHLIGDQILIRVATLLKEAFTHTVARWGGDEFAGFHIGEREETLNLVNNFLSAVRTDAVLAPYEVTVCFGITGYKEGDSANTLLYRADRALYVAKELGKDRFEMVE